MKRLSGRIVGVTGAARGLGRAYATVCAAEGAAVVANDLATSDELLDEVVAAIASAGGRAVKDTHRVESENGASALVAHAVEAFGDLHCVVNNAGVLRDAELHLMSDSQWDDVIRVHLTGCFSVMRAASRYWIGQWEKGVTPKASLINVTSGSGLFTVPGQINYCAAKGGVLSMTLAAAQELDRFGIRVNAISPGARTRGTWFAEGGEPEENYSTAHGAEMTPMVRVPRDGSFDEWDPLNVAPVVAWLAQEECRANGQVLRVRGGHIRVMEGWHASSGLDKAAPWTVEELNEQLVPLASVRPGWDVSDFEPSGNRT